MTLEAPTPAITYSASERVFEALNIYSEDIVSTKYPHPIDGLKKIHRRILYCLGTNSEKDAMTALIGDTSKLHQGGDASIYEAIVRLSQPFSVGEPLVWCPGNYGTYSNPSSAGHPRYLELASSQFARDIFWEGVTISSIPMVASKDFRRLEPEYFIPRVPMGIYINNSTIGIGYNSSIPQMNFGNVCDIVMLYIEQLKDPQPGFLNRIARLLLPDYPVKNYLINSEELVAHYQNGRYEVPIEIQGEIELYPKTVKIRSFPFMTIPITVFTNVIEQLKHNKGHWLQRYLKDINNYGGDDEYCDFTVDIKSTNSAINILDKLLTLFQIVKKIYPVYHYGYKGKLRKMYPLDVLAMWYDARYKSVLSGIKKLQVEYQYEVLKYSAYLHICDKADTVIDIVRNSDTEDTAVIRLSQEFPELTRKQCRIVAQSKISTITKSSKDTIAAELDKFNAKLRDTNVRIEKIPETIYNDASYLKKKYSKPRKTVLLQESLGYVHIDTKLFIQYFSEKELLDIYLRFKNSSIAVYSKNNLYPYVIIYTDKGQLYDEKTIMYQSYPKYIYGGGLLYSPSISPKLAVVQNRKIAVLDKDIAQVRISKSDFSYYLITDTVYGITRKGTVECISCSEFSTRKSISTGSRTQYEFIFSVPEGVSEVILFSVNTHQKNMLYINKVQLQQFEYVTLNTVPDRYNQYLGVWSPQQQGYYLTIPSEISSVGFVRIDDIDDIFKDTNIGIVIDLSKSSKKGIVPSKKLIQQL